MFDELVGGKCEDSFRMQTTATIFNQMGYDSFKVSVYLENG